MAFVLTACAVAGIIATERPQICFINHGTTAVPNDFRGVLTVAKGKRTFQPNNRRRARVHGFRLRMRTRAGRSIVSARRGKGRAKLTA